MHSMPDFCGSWRGIKTRVERQTTTSVHVRVRHPWETCSFTLFSASVSTLNRHQIFTYFVQRRSFLSLCYHFNLKQAFKVNNLVPMTKHQGRCQMVACPLPSQQSRMLMQKRPLFLLMVIKEDFVVFLLCYISSRTKGLDVHVNWYTMANEVPVFIFFLNAQKNEISK